MRGKGVGTALLRYIAKTAEDKNCGRIEWTVVANNARGIDFYQRHGATIQESVKLCRVESATITRLSKRN